MGDVYTVHENRLVADPVDPSQDTNIADPVEALAANGYHVKFCSNDPSNAELCSGIVAVYRHRLHGFFIEVLGIDGDRIIAVKAGSSLALLVVLEKIAPLLHLIGLDQRYAIHVANALKGE